LGYVVTSQVIYSTILTILFYRWMKILKLDGLNVVYIYNFASKWLFKTLLNYLYLYVMLPITYLYIGIHRFILGCLSAMWPNFRLNLGVTWLRLRAT